MIRSRVLLVCVAALGCSGALRADSDPSPTGLAVKLTLSDKAPDENGLVPIAGHDLAPVGRLYCEYEVTGPVPEGQTLESAFVLRTAGGQVVASSTPRPFAAKEDGRIRRRMAVPLEALAGEHELVVTVTARPSGQSWSALASFAVRTAAAAVPAGPPPKAIADPVLADLLKKGAAYAQQAEQELSRFAAQEDYVQKLFDKGRTRIRQHYRTRSEVVFVTLGGPVRWMAFRDVFEVNGERVPDRGARLERLFSGGDRAAAAERAQAMLLENARYNLGDFDRNFNSPTLPLVFLAADNQPRFDFRLKGTDKVEGRPARVVAYQETYSPAFIRDEGGHDLFVHGKLWIDEETGRLVKSEMSVKRLVYADANRKTASDAAVHEGYQVDVIVEFGPQPEIGAWPPRRMSELCESKDVAGKAMVGNSMSMETGEVVEALASYSDYKARP